MAAGAGAGGERVSPPAAAFALVLVLGRPYPLIPSPAADSPLLSLLLSQSVTTVRPQLLQAERVTVFQPSDGSDWMHAVHQHRK